MAQENVKLIRRMYDAFRARDISGLDYFDPNVVVDARHRVDGRADTDATNCSRFSGMDDHLG